MSNDKKTNELNDDQLEQAAGGAIRRTWGGWQAIDDNETGRNREKSPTFIRENDKERAIAYAKSKGWSTEEEDMAKMFIGK